jgi:hypothetical protein
VFLFFIRDFGVWFRQIFSVGPLRCMCIFGSDFMCQLCPMIGLILFIFVFSFFRFSHASVLNINIITSAVARNVLLV